MVTKLATDLTPVNTGRMIAIGGTSLLSVFEGDMVEEGISMGECWRQWGKERERVCVCSVVSMTGEG